MFACENISKTFGGTQALVNVTVQFPTRGITSIIGPNGAGKTTLLNILSGFSRQSAGRCLFQGRDISRLAPFQIARLGVARSFQDLRLIERAHAVDNVLLARPMQSGEKLLAALTRIGTRRQELANKNAALAAINSVGLESKSQALAGALSYGEQKLLSLACCVASEARVLLLDEPFSGLAPNLIEKTIAILTSIRDAGRVIILIEHDLHAVRAVSDVILAMSAGRVIDFGPAQNVLRNQSLIEAYLE